MSRILIIEDETPMRTALADVLEGEGYRALAAADGNISVASKRLGLSRNTIYRKLRWGKGD